MSEWNCRLSRMLPSNFRIIKRKAMTDDPWNTYDKRAKRATHDYPNETNISKRVKMFEAANDLKPFTPKEILHQRNNQSGEVIHAKPLSRECPQCQKDMFVKGVCPSCEAFANGMRTHWICSGCGAEQYSKKDHGTWIKELSQ